MTIGKLIWELKKLQRKHGDRLLVSVDKPSFFDGNGTFDICSITDVLYEWVATVDGDGFSMETKRGQEIGKWGVTLSGGGNLSKGKRV